ncbi:hypothetical protein ACO2RV_12490 [Ancylobacter sp. VNQ12]|uniref:hypothetical protein n=1 Tax=Ancylobacter sp. VNQ12 TaxID=3400920 RepID=UPI003BFAD458
MSNVIPFPARPAPSEADADLFDIDLLTAVDVAIRDLRDLAQRLHGDETGQEQAQECLSMLARALENARAYG